mgnify:CR=1 FL=1
MDSNSFDLDKKRAAWVGISALGTLFVSYMVYRKVTEESEAARKRKQERSLRRVSRSNAAKTPSTANTRIVGAN